MLGEAGAKVVLLDRDAQAAEREAACIANSVGRGLDVSDAAAIERRFASIGAQGPIDVLVNSAGMAIRKPALELELDDWNRVINVNLTGTFLCARAAARHMSTTGSLTRWFRDELARDLSPAGAYAELFNAAALVAPGSGGLLVLPYFSGERTPINDPNASGVIAGLGLTHTRAQMFRAVLEGVGFGVRHNLQTFASIGAHVGRVLAVGGGAKSDTWLQIISDITGVPQALTRVSIGASYGDAFLAGRAAGLVGPDDLQLWIEPDRVISPNVSRKPIYDAMFEQYLKLYTSTRDVMHALSAWR